MADKNYNELLKELKKYNEASHIEIYVPSLNEKISFKPLTVKQQTDIITGVMTAQQNENAYAYQNIIDDIIITNCEKEHAPSLLAFDRACILVQLRLDTMGETLELDGQTYNLADHVSGFDANTVDIESIDSVLEYEGITVQCAAPTLKDEVGVNTDVPKVYKTTTDENSVSNVFLIELTKYIETVTFDKNVITFEDLTLKQKIQICEMLPMSLSQQIVEYIEAIRELESPFINIAVEDGTSVEIPIDSQLFNK